jgi:hypothetical protein
MSNINTFRDFIAHLFIPRWSNNQRSRILHPKGLSVIVGIFLLNHSLRLLVANIPGLVLGFSSSITIEQVIHETNQKRSEAGLTALTQNPKLKAAAFAKAQDMFSQDYWAHISPTGTQPWYFIRNQGYSYQSAGENLARDFSNSSDMMNAWMGSASHRENILNSKYQDIGIAVVDGTLQGVETRLVVQMFGTPTPAPIAQVQAQTTPENTQPAQQTSEDLLIENQEIVSSEPIELEATDFGALVRQEPKEQFAETSLLRNNAVTRKGEKVISPTQVTQTFGILLVTLILGSLAIDWVVTHKKKAIRLVGKNWAHLTFLGVITLMMLQFIEGNIL